MRVVLVVHSAIVVAGLSTAIVFALRKRWARMLLALVFTVVTMALWYKATGTDKVASWIFPEDTVYAAGFSESVFNHLPPGADRPTVRRLLGEPLDTRVEGHREYWYFTHHGRRSKNYWNKVVIFDAASGRVVEKLEEFYTD